MDFVELFAGIGGFRYGLEVCNGDGKATQRDGKPNTSIESVQASNEDSRSKRNTPKFNSRQKKLYNCVYANEWNKYAAQIYEKNYANNNKETQKKRDKGSRPNSTNTNRESSASRGSESANGRVDTRDIREVPTKDIPDHALLTAGFPCQTFSVAGKRRGFEDTRGTLFFEIARIAKQKQPRLLLLENVKGLLSHDKGKTFGTILYTLDELGYDLQWQVLNSKNFGVPQNRERVFVVGHLRGTSRPEVFPIGRPNRQNVQESQEKQSKRAWVSTLDSIYGERWSTETYVRDTKIRRLTPTECERLQGFPDGWTEGISDTQRYKCLGNAVTTNVITAIGEWLYQYQGIN